MTVSDFKKNAREILSKPSPSPDLDIQVLLEFKLNLTKTQLLLNHNKILNDDDEKWLTQALALRQKGYPIAYITGHKEFFGYDFIVSPAVLIPKPDTEILVEQAIELILKKMENHPGRILTVCDMCTGSGCIALAVLKTLADVYKIPSGSLPKFTMIDISPSALEIAEKNIIALDVPEDRVQLVRSNLFEQFSPDGGWTFDLILTNPPYIPHSLVNKLLEDGRSEPRLALDGDVTLTGDAARDCNGKLNDDGLEIIRNLIPQSKTHLSPDGYILMETGEYNAEATALIAQSHGFKTEILKDLEGQLRVVQMN